MHKIITISRQFGSGGREIGRRLADTLTCAYYDKELLEAVANETGFDPDYINSFDETISQSYPYIFNRSFASYQQSPSEKIQLAYLKIIKDIAQKGNAVIIGRCAEYILKESKPFKVFIYASDINYRIERCYTKVPEDRVYKTETQMLKEIVAIDKERAKYYEYYSSKKWSDMTNYNLCIDTASVGIENAVKIIKSAVDLL